MTKINTKDFKKDLVSGLKYPWNKGSRLWYILWVLVPIFGWFVLGGYFKKIVKTLVTKQRKELPKLGSVFENFIEGVVIFVFMIPTFIVFGIIGSIPFLGNLASVFLSVFLVPWITINFFIKGNFMALWEIKKAFNLVFDNIKEYLFAYIKTIMYGIIYGILSLILIGIPCAVFGRLYYLTAFYKKHK